MTLFDVTIGSRSLHWKRDELEGRLNRIEKMDESRYYVNKKLQTRSRLRFCLDPFYQKRSAGAVKTLLQLRVQIRRENDPQLTKLFNSVMCRISLDSGITHPISLGKPSETLLCIQIGNRRPFLAEQQRCTSLGAVFKKPFLDPEEMIEDRDMDGHETDYHFPKMPDDVAKFIEDVCEGFQYDIPIQTFTDICAFLECIDQFQIEERFVKEIYQVISGKHSQDYLFGMRLNNKLSLSLNPSNQVSAILESIGPYAHHFSHVDFSSFEKLPSDLECFGLCELIIQPTQDFSPMAKKEISKITLDLSQIDSAEQFQQIMTEEKLNVLTRNGKRKIEIIGHNSLTTNNFVQILLTFPKNTLRSLDLSWRESLNYDQFKRILKRHHEVNQIDVNHCKFKSKRISSPKESVTKEKSYSSLSSGEREIKIIGYESLREKTFIQILLTLPKNSVRSLDFSSHQSISDDQLMRVLKHHSQVRDLNLNGCNYIRQFGDIAKTCAHLTTVKMDNLPWGGSFEAISCILKNSPKLEEASFQGWETSDIPDINAEELKNTATQKSLLRKLDFTGSTVKGKYWGEQVRFFASFLPRSLQEICLDNTNFAKDLIELLVDKKIRLQKISLNGCPGLTKYQLDILKRGIKSLKSITSEDLES